METTKEAVTLHSENAVGAIAPDTRGQNFYLQDRTLRDLAKLYLPHSLYEQLQESLTDLGFRVANDLDEHAMLANQHKPKLHHRDKFGRDQQWVEYHPSYRALEKAAFGDFGIHAMSHRATISGCNQALPVTAKHIYTCLFNQAEFGLGCPINVTDSAAHLLLQFGSDELKNRYLPRLLSQDMEELWQGAQFITEQEGGSDVGLATTQARSENGHWRLTGDKWFCSNVDAQVAMILARPEGAASGTRGLGLFAMPRVLPDGSLNRIRIVRLKDKFGTQAMASGELRMDGALADPVGDLDAGFKQMTEMINWSRLSNGVKSAALMRRSIHDAITVSKTRIAFGKVLHEHPLAQRQLLKMLLASEQAMSMWMFVADQLDCMTRGGVGSNEARAVARLATPVLKFRATRDARQVCGDAMEMRGGCGYIEEFVNPRLVRDAHLGSIWEGASNIIAIDAIRRAIGRSSCLSAYLAFLGEKLDECESKIPETVSELRTWIERLEHRIDVVLEANEESEFRQLTSALYHLTSALLMAWEGTRLSELNGDASRLLWSRLVIEHLLEERGPLTTKQRNQELEQALLAFEPTSLERARELSKR